MSTTILVIAAIQLLITILVFFGLFTCHTQITKILNRVPLAELRQISHLHALQDYACEDRQRAVDNRKAIIKELNGIYQSLDFDQKSIIDLIQNIRTKDKYKDLQTDEINRRVNYLMKALIEMQKEKAQ